MTRRLPIWAALLLLCAWCAWLRLKPSQQRLRPEAAPLAQATSPATAPTASAPLAHRRGQPAAVSDEPQQPSLPPAPTHTYSLESILIATSTPAARFSNEEVKRREAEMQRLSEALVRGYNRQQTLQQLGQPTFVFARHQSGPPVGKWKVIKTHYLTLKQALEAKEDTTWFYSPNPRYPIPKHPLLFKNLEVSFDEDGYLTNWVWSMPFTH